MALRLLLGVVLAIGLVGCAAAPSASRPAAIQHVVFFTLSDPALVPAFIDETRAMLAAVAEVRTPSVGTPLDTGRELAPPDYHVAVRMGFDDEDDYFAYLASPAHTAIVARWQPMLREVRVFDYTEAGVETGARRVLGP